MSLFDTLRNWLGSRLVRLGVRTEAPDRRPLCLDCHTPRDPDHCEVCETSAERDWMCEQSYDEGARSAWREAEREFGSVA